MITFAPRLKIAVRTSSMIPNPCKQQGSTHFSRKKCPKTTRTSPFKQARSRLAESESFQISPVGPWRSEQRAQFISCASSVLCTDPLMVSGMMGDTLGYIGIHWDRCHGPCIAENASDPKASRAASKSNAIFWIVEYRGLFLHKLKKKSVIPSSCQIVCCFFHLLWSFGQNAPVP